MISLKTENIGSVVKDLNDLTHDIEAETRDTLTEVGLFVQAEAIQRTPISPTKAQASSDPDYNFDAKKSPGTLLHSIDVRKGMDYVDVGVMTGSALAYADAIHNGQGKSWQNIGPGSRAKSGGAKVGGKFIDRAYDDNKNEIDKKFEEGANTSVDKFNR